MQVLSSKPKPPLLPYTLPRAGPALETMPTSRAVISLNESRKTAGDDEFKRSLRSRPMAINRNRILLQQVQDRVRAVGYSFATFPPLSECENAELVLDIEFENKWEATSDWNEDDVEAVMEERELCYPHLRRRGEGEGQGQGQGEGDVDVERAEWADGEGGEEPMELS